MRSVLAIALVAALGCSGEVMPSRSSGVSGAPNEGAPGSLGGTPGSEGAMPTNGAPTLTTDPSLVTGALGRGPTGVARLTRSEYASTVSAVLGVSPQADIELLPPDSFSPFDNEYQLQNASSVLVQGLDSVAERLADRLLADPTLSAALVGCVPSAPTDEVCYRQFVANVGRKLLRRPLGDEEIAEFLPFLQHASVSGSFNTAVGLALRALLQDLEFVYRFEIGAAPADVAAVIQLTDYELASRLSFLLWGQGPDLELLDASAAGTLQTPEGLRLAAQRLLDAPQGRARLQRFHALWLGYEIMPHDPQMNGAMRQETDALIDRIVFTEQRPWLDLLTMAETWVDPTLASHYGLTSVSNEAAWVPYVGSGRGGILSHGALLSNGAKAGETSPTLRGKFVLDRLLCQPVPPPPENLQVDADEPPPDVAGDNCKTDRYAAHRTGVCAGCHTLMDGLGFGLENYDALGRYRSVETDRPDCAIEGVGNAEALGTFSGPAELGALLAQSGLVEECLVQHFYQFALGRGTRPDDETILTSLVANLKDHDYGLRALILDWVSHDSFRHRVVDTL